MRIIAIRRRDLIAVLGTVAIAWPLAAVAQQSRVPLVGVLRTSSKDAEIFLRPFRRYIAMPDLRHELAQCPHRWDMSNPCQVKYVD